MKQTTPTLLGLGGLIPFVLLTGLSLLGPAPWREFVMTALLAYGAVILSFLGGITWGLAVDEKLTRRPIYLASMVPFFAAWLALLLQPLAGLILLACAFLAALANDFMLKRAGLSPQWFMTLRLSLTVIVVTCLVLAAFGT